ncbi:MAG: alcohol dehydrogenase catalytic domain-containing protein [Actinobacteria bacterium]|nr:alcohol dehydrogenase catalytic domain-containing protein [Actinomycetota bacterium]
MELQDIDEPSVKAGEAVVDVAACGICGSELHGISQPGFRQPPLVMGHEFAGTTADGRRVAVNPLTGCGQCSLCHSGQERICPGRAIVGIHRAGGFAPRVVVPERSLHDLPAHLSWEAGAMVEPLANGVHAWGLAGAPKSSRVGVIGAGTIGLVCLLAAQRGGADEIAVADLSERRLEVAGGLGADVTSPALEGEFDVIFDAVGLPATHQASVDRLRPGGIAVWLGLMSPDAGFDATALVRQEKRVTGSFAYTDDEFSTAVQMAGEVDLGWADSFPLNEGAQVFMSLMHGRDDVTKALLRP